MKLAYSLVGLLILLCLPYGSSFAAMPCCAIQFQEPDQLPPIFNVSRIVLTYPITCNNTCVATMYYLDGNEVTPKSMCINGFNVMSFLMTVIQRMGKQATPEQLLLFNKLNKNIESFAHGAL